MKLEFPHIFVYEASAGSGKTRRLARRYVDFLLNHSGNIAVPFNFRNILAVTFTNEAADQMKQEILKMLKTKALGKSRDAPVAMQIVDEIIHNYSDFAVRTIDSFVHSLLVASSLELKLPPDYEIMPQPRPYLEYVLDALLDEVIYDQDIAELFLEFLNYFLIVEGQKHWSPKKTLLSLLVRFYQEENRRALPFREICRDSDLSKMEKSLKVEIEQFLSLVSSQPDFNPAPSTEEHRIRVGRGGVNQRFIKGLYSLLDNSGLAFLKSLSRYINKPRPELNPIPSWQRLKSKYDNYARAFVWSRYSFYLKVFSKFRQRLEDFKEEKRIVFLDELNKKARQFLTSEGLLPTEIYYKLSSVLYHYLIDEFQDTSILQWENIQALVGDALSKGGSLFYVGDKKQAIYRFRGGEVKLFGLIKAQFRNRVAKIYDRVLLCNYRSPEVIVEFNNLVFSQENLEGFLSNFPRLSKEFQKGILAVFKNSQQKPAGVDSQGGYVRLEILKGENKQQLQDCLNIKLKETILELVQRFHYQDILIMLRNNQEAQQIADFLLAQGFPVCAWRTISIRQNYLIRQIIALLKFLNSPIDNLCFANFILGEAFSKATQLDSQILRSWLEKLRLNQDRDILYTRFRSAFPAIWGEFLQYPFNAVGFLPVYDLVKIILIRFKIEENFPHLCGFTRRLLEILNELEEQGRNSLSEFLQWFESAEEEDLFVRLPSGFDAIKILTIHKAKGLTSAVVILPYAALEVKVGEVPFEAPKIVYEKPDGLYLLYPQKDICLNHAELSLIYQREYCQALLDELNCLYVAFTRAASELYIFLPQKVNRSNNPLISLLFKQEQDLKEFGSRIIYSVRPKYLIREPQKEIEPPRILPQEMFKDILKNQLIRPEQIILPEKRYLINRGDLLHYLLAEIDLFGFLNHPPSYIPEIKDICRLFNYPDPEEIIQCLFDFLKHPSMRLLFNPKFPAFNEREVVDGYGNLRRIDRLVFAEDKILIVDYKTGQAYQKEHQQQINEYARLIKEIYPDRLCQGWLIYTDTKEVHLVKDFC